MKTTHKQDTDMHTLGSIPFGPPDPLPDTSRLGVGPVRRALAADMREIIGAEYDDFVSITQEDVRVAFGAAERRLRIVEPVARKEAA